VIQKAASLEDEADEDDSEPLDMAFPPSGLRKQATYIILFPIIFPLWLTLPDTRSEKSKLSMVA
jgi:sodium/potassium/calcium exchanger 2